MKRESPAPTPAVATAEGLSAKSVYLDLVQGLRVQVRDLRRDKAILVIVALLSLLCLAVALPLQKRIPYFFEVDSSTGRVALTNRVGQELKVTDTNISYFLRLWTARVVTINAGTLKEGLPSAYRWTRGAASRELDDWTTLVDKTTQRIVKSPGLTREIIGSPTVSFNEERNVAFIDFVWLEKVDGIERERKHKVLTLEFGLTPPRGAEEEADNPIGLAITHFTVNDLVSK